MSLALRMTSCYVFKDAKLLTDSMTAFGICLERIQGASGTGRGTGEPGRAGNSVRVSTLFSPLLLTLRVSAVKGVSLEGGHRCHPGNPRRHTAGRR